MVNGLPNNSFSKNLRNKLHHSASNTMQSLPKYKNYCLMSGRGRTYNRFLYMARHNVRKLVGVGAISGLVK
jgi:ribosomal protein S14